MHIPWSRLLELFNHFPAHVLLQALTRKEAAETFLGLIVFDFYCLNLEFEQEGKPGKRVLPNKTEVCWTCHFIYLSLFDLEPLKLEHEENKIQVQHTRTSFFTICTGRLNMTKCAVNELEWIRISKQGFRTRNCAMGGERITYPDVFQVYDILLDTLIKQLLLTMALAYLDCWFFIVGSPSSHGPARFFCLKLNNAFVRFAVLDCWMLSLWKAYKERHRSKKLSEWMGTWGCLLHCIVRMMPNTIWSDLTACTALN